MELSKTYIPGEVETKWYQHWIDQGYFHSEPNDKPAYTVVIPPPNVTGVLHMGHCLNNTIQDILVRRAPSPGWCRFHVRLGFLVDSDVFNVSKTLLFRRGWAAKTN